MTAGGLRLTTKSLDHELSGMKAYEDDDDDDELEEVSLVPRPGGPVKHLRHQEDHCELGGTASPWRT